MIHDIKNENKNIEIEAKIITSYDKKLIYFFLQFIFQKPLSITI